MTLLIVDSLVPIMVSNSAMNFFDSICFLCKGPYLSFLTKALVLIHGAPVFITLSLSGFSTDLVSRVGMVLE